MTTNSKKIKLHCEIGDHEFDYPAGRRGRKPKNCTAHKPKQEDKPRSPEAIKATVERILETHQGRPCSCGIEPSMGVEELKKLGAGCTSPSHVCSTLDAIRRAVVV